MTAGLSRRPAPPLGGRQVRAFGDRLSLRFRARSAVVCALVLAGTLVTAIASVRFGDPPVAVGTTIDVFLGRADFADAFIVVQLALPRIATAILVGAALGVSGAIFQSLSRNPLGSPDIIGFNVGAATGAIAAILYLPDLAYGASAAAVAAGITTALVVYLLAWQRGMRGYRLILVGIGLTALLQSVNSFMLAKADLLRAQGAHLWLYGSLNARTWENAGLVAVAMAVLLPVILLLGSRLSVLEMGDETAYALGVPVERTRITFLVLGTALPAVAIAVAGPIAFVALAAPQLVRRLTRAPGPHLGPSACMGALLLVAADFVAQHVIPGASLPVGLATGALGGVYLAWLLASEWRSGRMRAR